MPSIFGVSFLSDSGVLIGLIVTAACVVLVADWRMALLAVALQYVMVGALLTGVVSSGVATVRVISGGLAAAILFLSMQRRAADERTALGDADVGDLTILSTTRAAHVFLVGFPFRFFAVALVAVSIIGLASSMTLLSLSAYVLFGALWLMSIGLLVAMLSRDSLRLGMGILLFTSGFCIMDTAVESSLFLYGLLNIADLLIALAVSHLATLPSEAGENRRREDMP